MLSQSWKSLHCPAEAHCHSGYNIPSHLVPCPVVVHNFHVPSIDTPPVVYDRLASAWLGANYGIIDKGDRNRSG